MVGLDWSKTCPFFNLKFKIFFKNENKKGGPSWTPWNCLSQTYAKPCELLEAIKLPKFGQISKLLKNNNKYNGAQVPTIVVPLFYLSILGYIKPLLVILP